ncbi:MAG: hypothetical protein J0H78_12975 [Rhizobiales bacterium]|nr:hypothetical protein [Hyphomicrobiales bacterium]OJY43449.1 MAG: hypothetical protein BGP08_01310 [Rhizobiales bacterium 64-17]
MLEALYSNQNFAATLLMVVGMSGATRSNAQVEAEVAKLKASGVVEKSGCAAAQNAPGYVCDFKWGSKQPSGGTNWGQPMKARFFKSGSAWAVEI